jgi:hypothetical protein
MNSSNPITLPLLGQLISRGDGTYVLKPSVPEGDGEQWVDLRQAARIIGHISPKSLYRMLGEYLACRRPTPRRILVSLNSVLRYKQAIGDTEFWTDPARRARLRRAVEQEMARHIEESLRVTAPAGGAGPEARPAPVPAKAPPGGTMCGASKPSLSARPRSQEKPSFPY